MYCIMQQIPEVDLLFVRQIQCHYLEQSFDVKVRFAILAILPKPWYQVSVTNTVYDIHLSLALCKSVALQLSM